MLINAVDLGKHLCAGLFLGGFVIHFSARHKAIQAVETFNGHLSQTSFWDNTQLQFGFTGSGIISVALLFD